jgi:hypothetical protein
VARPSSPSLEKRRWEGGNPLSVAAEVDASCRGQFAGIGELPQVQRVARAPSDWSSDQDEHVSRGVCKRQVNDV